MNRHDADSSIDHHTAATVVVRTTDGVEADVTEDVKTVLDLLHSSLDWGSGFLSTEEMESWNRVAGLLGFDGTWPK